MLFFGMLLEVALFTTDKCFRLNLYGYKGEVEDLYTSKRKELKNFKENLALFWDTLVLECQNGPLFDNVLFEKCMDYVIALSW